MGARGDSLLVSDGRSDIFGFVKLCLVFLWVRYLVHDRYFLGLLIRKFDKVSARLSFSPRSCRAVAEDAIKPLVFIYHEAMSTFLGSKMF